MHLQSIGYEEIEDERSGAIFPCVKLTAFECKTKEEHLNQFLAASNAWRCGVGGLGVSILLRLRLCGEPPPFSMCKDERSWKVVGTSTGKSFDRRLNDAFALAGVRRQSGDPVTYLGRHFGTRRLQHQGGSAEGRRAARPRERRDLCVHGVSAARPPPPHGERPGPPSSRRTCSPPSTRSRTPSSRSSSRSWPSGAPTSSGATARSTRCAASPCASVPTSS